MCAGISATVVWALAWLAAACIAMSRAAAAPTVSAWLGVGVALLMVALHSWVLLRLLRRGRAFHPVGPVTRSWHRPWREPWPHRILGYLAVILFVGVAVVWNGGFIGRLVQAANEKEGWVMLVLIPWSLLGWLLLIMLFATIGVLFRSLLTGLRRFVP
jgi:hypothetical protein